MDRVEDELHDGRSIREIAFLGYTRAACFEALERAQKITSFENKRFWFRTIHSTCFRLMRERGIFKQVVTQKQRKDFCQSVGLEIPEYQEEVLQGEKVTPGTAFYAIENYLVNTMKPVDTWYDTPLASDFNRQDFIDIHKKWITYKIMNNFIDFTDMLISAYKTPCNIPTKVMFVDEFQDLSPLQLELVRKFMVGKEKVFIAGDDDQALYRFQGADPEIILDFPADDIRILEKSYRCPREIFTHALNFISLNCERQSKEIDPRDGNGQIRILFRPSISTIQALISGKTYILLRTNMLVNFFCWTMASAGILYNYLDKEKDRFLGWTKKKLSLMDKIVGMPFDIRRNFLEELMFEERISRGLHGFLRGYIFRKDRVEPEKVNVFVGTIHSAKGKEADTVFLFDDITARVESSLRTPEGQEDERRVWYVGMTRARENLNIIHRFFTKPFISSYNLPQQLGVSFSHPNIRVKQRTLDIFDKAEEEDFQYGS